MSRVQNWTPAEEKTIRTMFAADCEDSAMAERLGRTAKAVEGRRVSMGLYRIRQPGYINGSVRRSRVWTVEETDMLISSINMGWDNARIGSLLGRSENSVRGKREIISGQRATQHAGSASVLASLEAVRGWPRACPIERKRGERLLNKFCHREGQAFGKPFIDNRTCNPMRMSKPVTSLIGESSLAWAV